MTLADLWLKLCLWPSSIIANLERTISFMTFLWDILCLSTWLDCRRISSQASFFFMAPAACLHCLQNPRLAGWGWISGKYREEESTKLSHPLPPPSRQIGEFEALMLWTFFVRSWAHYDCGGGSREVNETKYKWKQTETNWPNSAVAAKAKYENKFKIQKNRNTNT